jgi:hypothetical protein
MTRLPNTVDTVKEKSVALIQSIRKKDAERADFPGEHLIVFAVGTLLLFGARRSRSTWGRSLMAGIGTALIGRAASGRGGIARLGSAWRDHGNSKRQKA